MQRKGQPIMILTCQHDSHFFEERTIIVNETVKVGRAVARTKAAPNNAIFDCKVLSRNHALIWFNSDEFWLRDTNSSNGTFVNNTRVSKREDNDNCDRQIFSGDVIRFGVDVVEHDTTHGCIVAMVTLILPNGQEARPKLGQAGDILPSGLVSINNEQMFQISCFLNDALFREQALDRKLEALKQALHQATIASEVGWQAMLNEEKLLQKFDLYESQLRMFKEDLSENSLKVRISDLLEEKSRQEVESKDQLTKLIKEKEAAFQRIKDLERTIEDLQTECNHLQNEYFSAQETCNNLSEEYKSSLNTISQRVNELAVERNQLNEQLQAAAQEKGALKEDLDTMSHELAVTKELYERLRLRGSSGLVNGISYASDAEKESNGSTNAKDGERVFDPYKGDDDGLLRANEDREVGEDLLLASTKLDVNEYISDSIRDFHRALELIHILDDRISDLAVTTDLDEVKRKVERQNVDSETVQLAVSDSSTDMAVALATASSGAISGISAFSLDNLVKLIVRHNETAMTSLHAYLRQVNPTAAAELIKKIYLDHPGIDGSSEALATPSPLPSEVAVEGKTLMQRQYKRPDHLKLDKAVDSSTRSAADTGSCDVGGVTVVGADSLCASPTVSSGSGSLSVSPDNEEVAYLRERVRQANEEIEHYKAHIAELLKSGGVTRENNGVETAAPTSRECGGEESGGAEGPSADLEAVHAECSVLRARLGDIEEQLAATRDNHRRLVEEAHAHRREVEDLRAERAHLAAALADAQAQLKTLSPASSSSNASSLSQTTASSATPTVQRAATTAAERLELAPGRLVTVPFLTAIPLMLLVFAVMFAVFSKFVS